MLSVFDSRIFRSHHNIFHSEWQIPSTQSVLVRMRNLLRNIKCVTNIFLSFFSFYLIHGSYEYVYAVVVNGMLQGYTWLEHDRFYWNVKRLKVLVNENATITVAMCHKCTRAFAYRAKHFPFWWYKMTRKLYRKSCVSFICIHIKCHLNSRREWFSKRFISRHQSCEI